MELLPEPGEMRHVVETLREWEMSHPRDLRGKPRPKATNTDTPNHRHHLTPSCFSWGNSICEGPWLGTVVTSPARTPRSHENTAEACVGREFPAGYPKKLAVPAEPWDMGGVVGTSDQVWRPAD